MGEHSFLTTKIPWRDANERVIGLLGISRDITEQINDRETIEQQRSELFHVSRLSTMGEMTAQISHEIKQPLSAVSNYTGACLLALDQGNADRGKICEYLQLILQQAKRADDVMERIQSFAHRGKPIQVVCDLRELITGSISVISSELKQHRVTVLTDVAPDNFIKADAVLMQQVIVNLLMNASDAMKNQPAFERKVEIKCTATNTDVQVDVVDCGPGISPDVINRIFETFFTTKTKTEGMGLAISKEIVESHRGRLEALNNSDKSGATFRFHVPRIKGMYDSKTNHPSGR
jgi:C4-dicarboxylate-specific signal transduction histidine kinase